ncbi:hypothetical protein LCGC14_2078520, partial [marine sediment metagenome]
HPAKMDAQLLIWIVERYTKEGEVILDPMAGSGTMMLACTLGRNVVLVELEEKFCKMMADNWQEVKMRPQLGSQMGACQIIQGDARQLEGLVDKVITSPPYSDMSMGGGLNTKPPREGSNDQAGRSPKTPSQEGAGGYVDKIVTSPPYEGTTGEGKEIGSEGHAVGAFHYGNDSRQIGNLKSDSYLEAMLQVYQQCRKVLKPQGLMILVTKNFLRDRQEIRLDTDTIALCEQAGFQFVERHSRRLPSQSFWRVIYAKKYPDAPVINKEDILVFKKL